MWDFISGRSHTRAAEQAEVDRAIASERQRTRRGISELTEEVDGLRGSEARMMEYFQRLQSDAGRAKRGHH